jgi:hypothetical protein
MAKTGRIKTNGIVGIQKPAPGSDRTTEIAKIIS